MGGTSIRASPRPGPAGALGFEERQVTLDTAAEILAKKLLFRADAFKARDVFDMSAALALDRPAALAALHATARTRPALLRRLAMLADTAGEELAADILMTVSGTQYARSMVARVAAAASGNDTLT